MGGKLYFSGGVFSPRLRYVNVIALVVEWVHSGVPSFLAIEVPCAPLLRGIMDEYF